MKQALKPDVLLKEFWRNNERFADLFNGVFFQGERIIEAEDLEDVDTDMSGMMETKEYKETLVRTRDVIKKTAYGMEFVLWGQESQLHIHYAMPLRSMLYDGLGYLKNVKELGSEFRNKKKRRSADEFLSKMGKEDKIRPIITLVVYYGEEPWDGPTCLKDMMIREGTEIPKKILGLVSDYRMNLLEIRKTGECVFSNPEVKALFDVTREIYEKKFEEVEKRVLPKEVKEIVTEVTGFQELLEVEESQEGIEMCRALEELREEYRSKGRSEGRQEGRREGFFEGQLSAAKLMIESGMELTKVAMGLKIEPEKIVEYIKRQEAGI